MATPSLLRQHVPPVGTVAQFHREAYDPTDHAETRRGVVVAVQGPNALVMMRSTTSKRPGDIEHKADLRCGCTSAGRWQPSRVHRIALAWFDLGSPEVLVYAGLLDAVTLAAVLAAWKGA